MMPYEWRYPVERPRQSIMDYNLPLVPETVRSILFRAKNMYLGLLPHSEDTMYQYICVDCWAATGDKNSFTSSWAKLSELATEDQQQEMSDHAKQHSVIWAWVNSIERKK